MKVNPLICYLRPKDIPEVLDNLKEIPCDKLYINYYAYPFPHRAARDYFLAHEEYTHLCIVTNDLVVTLKNYRKMIDNVYNYPFLDVLCGVCNVDQDQESEYWNICPDLPPLGSMDYHWYKSSLRDYLKGAIIRVAFAGFPFMCVARHVIQGLMLRPGRPGYDGCDLFGKDGFAADNWFCHALWDIHVPIYCDTSIEMEHLRYQYEMQVGKKEPNCELHRDSQILNVTDEVERLVGISKTEIQSSCKSVQGKR